MQRLLTRIPSPISGNKYGNRGGGDRIAGTVHGARSTAIVLLPMPGFAEIHQSLPGQPAELFGQVSVTRSLRPVN